MTYGMDGMEYESPEIIEAIMDHISGGKNERDIFKLF